MTLLLYKFLGIENFLQLINFNKSNQNQIGGTPLDFFKSNKKKQIEAEKKIIQEQIEAENKEKERKQNEIN